MLQSYVRYVCTATLVAFSLSAVIVDEKKLRQTNLLYIMFDDLRPELSVYGRHHMITPNFERLAARSVVFDNAHAQISVCNPSRDSILTGLRPDTVGTYGFQSSFRPFLTFPTRLAKTGYNTASYGKIAHWETEDPHIWNHEHWDSGWYKYQEYEWSIMNSSSMPDKIQPEEKFRDYIFASRTIETLKNLSAKDKFFMLAVGFKLPHIQMHFPHKYYEMYKNKTSEWALSKKELRFPQSAPPISYRCCAAKTVQLMEDEGGKKCKTAVRVGNINEGFTDGMYNELMIGYAASVSFVDAQVGRILDAIDELELWYNTTVVLTSDHGMHNGEKGIWEKWSMFDESTRVPLMIAQPQSPYKGQHYTGMVELVDIFPTLNDILGAPKYDKSKYCVAKLPDKDTNLPNAICLPLQGKSLAGAVLGSVWEHSARAKRIKAKKAGGGKKQVKKTSYFESIAGIHSGKLQEINTKNTTHTTLNMLAPSMRGGNIDRGIFSSDEVRTTNSITYKKNFAISQSWRCSPQDIAVANKNMPYIKSSIKGNSTDKKPIRASEWVTCDKTVITKGVLSIMGYSMRTNEFRYTAWYFYNQVLSLPLIDSAPFEEELYDHREEKLEDFTHRETSNLIFKPSMVAIVRKYRKDLNKFVREDIVFRGRF